MINDVMLDAIIDKMKQDEPDLVDHINKLMLGRKSPFHAYIKLDQQLRYSTEGSTILIEELRVQFEDRDYGRLFLAGVTVYENELHWRFRWSTGPGMIVHNICLAVEGPAWMGAKFLLNV